jgi:superfamily II DNA or RNA helicase
MGDRIHQISPAELQAENRIMQARLEVRHTDFDYPNASDDYQGMLTALVKDRARNSQIVRDVINQILTGKGIALIISDRVSHCRELYDNIAARGIAARLLTGKTPAKERAAIVEDLHQGKAQALVSTAQLIGEGFDLKDMSSIFMTTPVRFTGRVKQYIGRVLRVAEGKIESVIYDYVDRAGLLQHTFKSRLAAYADMGVSLQ